MTSLRHCGAELLVEPEALPEDFRVHRRRAGMTLMHPWANRLGTDRFPVADADVVVARGDPAVTRDAAGLPIHGLAPAGAWSVVSDGPAAAVAVRRFPALSAFPFAHEVAVRVDVRPGARLDVHTSVVATGADPVPVAFGWHPYLRLPGAPRSASRLTLPRRRHVGLDERGLPSGTVEEQEAERDPVGDRTFDDGFEALDDGAVLAVAGLRVLRRPDG
jgi:galactose mutarotase-like enzyme